MMAREISCSHSLDANRPLNQVFGNETRHAKSEPQKDHKGAELSGFRFPGQVPMMKSM